MNSGRKIKALAVVSLLVLSFFPATSAEERKKLKPQTTTETGSQLMNEAAWKDERWNQMDVGQFISSSLRVGEEIILKGLSIRVGDKNEATVCYDTALCQFRAGWFGGFVQFDPERFGLINMPQPAQEISFFARPLEDWMEKKPRHRGIFLRGKRIVLACDAGGTSILETPWFEELENTRCLTRSFEAGPAKQTLALNMIEIRNGKAVLQDIDGVPMALLNDGNQLVAAALLGADGSALSVSSNRVDLTFFPGDTTRASKVLIWSGHTNEVTRFAALVKKCKPVENLQQLTQPGLARWGSPLLTTGELAPSFAEPYVVDTISVPYDNPFRALMFLSGVDFFGNGDAAVCTVHGDVWRVSGIDRSLQKIKWKRFATGLFQPLGVKIVNEKVHVLGRDQITVLHDRNDNGEADFHENFCNEIKTSPGGHDYVTALERDAQGNFYHADPTGVYRVSPNGKKYERLARGLRNPNGMGISPEGIITVAPQEGEWTPASSICEVRPGAFYGNGGPDISSKRPDGYDAPLCWIPRLVDNSTASQVWVTGDKWGPLKGQMLSLSFGRCSMLLILREVVDGISQGGAVPLKLRFISGAMRGTFRKSDGQLYVVGSSGWQTSAVAEGCFQRVRYTGGKVHLPVALHVLTNGIELIFSEALDRETAEDAGSFAIETWNYIYSKNYGSREYSISQPTEIGHDPLEVKSARLSADGKNVFLEIAGLAPVMQMKIQYNLNSADGKTVKGEIYNTIHRLGKNRASSE